ncbi:MAG TPA: hypothetical protein VFS43_28155 [Polyangiaceae bacterium]|nr:hypothetical protein [Polyangiaceae bacterium]
MNQTLEDLQALRQQINRYLFRVQAATEADEAKLRVLLENMRALESMINALTLQEAKLAALSLQGQAAALDGLGATIEAEAKTIADVEKVLAAAAQAVGVAAQITAVLVGR